MVYSGADDLLLGLEELVLKPRVLISLMSVFYFALYLTVPGGSRSVNTGDALRQCGSQACAAAVPRSARPAGSAGAQPGSFPGSQLCQPGLSPPPLAPAPAPRKAVGVQGVSLPLLC